MSTQFHQLTILKQQVSLKLNLNHLFLLLLVSMYCSMSIQYGFCILTTFFTLMFKGTMSKRNHHFFVYQNCCFENYQNLRLTHQVLPHMQFHWQLETTNLRFWLVNILLRKFDTLSKKEIKMIKTNFMMKKKTKKTTKKYQKST